MLARLGDDDTRDLTRGLLGLALQDLTVSDVYRHLRVMWARVAQYRQALRTIPAGTVNG